MDVKFLIYLQVLKASKHKEHQIQQNGTDPNSDASQTQENNVSNNSNISEDQPINKKQRLMDKIAYDDLDVGAEDITNSKTTINLSKVSYINYIFG